MGAVGHGVTFLLFSPLLLEAPRAVINRAYSA